MALKLEGPWQSYLVVFGGLDLCDSNLASELKIQPSDQNLPLVINYTGLEKEQGFAL